MLRCSPKMYQLFIWSFEAVAAALTLEWRTDRRTDRRSQWLFIWGKSNSRRQVQRVGFHCKRLDIFDSKEWGASKFALLDLDAIHYSQCFIVTQLTSHNSNRFSDSHSSPPQPSSYHNILIFHEMMRCFHAAQNIMWMGKVRYKGGMLDSATWTRLKNSYGRHTLWELSSQLLLATFL